jgi:uncharacterized membrane protein|tara:strand:- start:2110 stop:2295 length:186 start_codon:yes stop_codon:yes gene_type:complete
VKEFFGSIGFLFVVVGVVVLILLKELWKAHIEGRKAMVYSLLLTLTVVVIATAVVLYSFEV